VVLDFSWFVIHACISPFLKNSENPLAVYCLLTGRGSFFFSSLLVVKSLSAVVNL
jgi:hypothetical protein